ncbi:hypothetical protein GDO78_003942 [Eleutherodactylus coqui]|uniref:Uncharacterized protein n=1 Tax=Eleutherodactylus coqui TaxID=57060 RepID=A0A8J6EUD6_ELECQ|nr:hypothetical protein GDO78_003942 [Eleutherodactylus coqui]
MESITRRLIKLVFLSSHFLPSPVQMNLKASKETAGSLLQLHLEKPLGQKSLRLGRESELLIKLVTCCVVLPHSDPNTERALLRGKEERIEFTGGRRTAQSASGGQFQAMNQLLSGMLSWLSRDPI